MTWQMFSRNGKTLVCTFLPRLFKYLASKELNCAYSYAKASTNPELEGKTHEWPGFAWKELMSLLHWISKLCRNFLCKYNRQSKGSPQLDNRQELKCKLIYGWKYLLWEQGNSECEQLAKSHFPSKMDYTSAFSTKVERKPTTFVCPGIIGRRIKTASLLDLFVLERGMIIL